MNKLKFLWWFFLRSALVSSFFLIFLFIKTTPAFATVVTNVSFTPASSVANTSTTWTFTLAPSNGATPKPLRSSGDTITIVFPSGFNVSGLTTANVGYGTGFGAGSTPTSLTVTGQSIALVSNTGGGGNVLDAGVVGTFTLSGITNATAGTYAAAGFTIKTNRDITPVANGSDITLTANTVAPTMTTSAATGITATGGVINGEVDSTGGGNTTVTFEYGSDSGLVGASTVTATQSPVADPGADVAVSYTLSGLTTETRYYYRVIGVNSAGTTNGSILSFVPSTSTRYWVGGTGNWSDANHWSMSSGGSSGASVPQYTNDTRFDASSFSANGQTLTLDATAATKSMDWTGALNTPTFAVNTKQLTIAGSLTFISAMTRTGNFSFLIFDSATTNNITLAGQTFDVNSGDQNAKFTGGGTWNMQDDWAEMPSTALFMEEGTFNTNNHSFTLRQFYDGSGHSVVSNTVNVNFGSSSLHIVDSLSLTKAGTTLTSSSSTLTFEPDIDFTIISVKAGTTFASILGQPGTNTGSIWHMSDDVVTVGTLTLDPAGSSHYELSGMTVGSLVSNGSAGSLVKVTQNIVASSQLSADYLTVTSSTCSGVTPCYAGSHSTNGGGNSGWTFTAPPATATTNAASALTTTTATLNGAANGKGDSAATTFVYGRTADLSGTTTTVTATQSPVTGSSDTSVSYALTGLLSNTKYYYKVSITNSYGATEGSIVSFTTSSVSSSGSSSPERVIPDPGVASFWHIDQPFNNTLSIAGSSGGSINSGNGQANLTLGAGSSSSDTFFWLAPRTTADVLAGNSVAGTISNIPSIVLNGSTSQIYELDPSNLSNSNHITRLDKPVTMTLDVDNLTDNTKVYFYDTVAKKWSLLNTYLVTSNSNKTVSFVTQNAGLYVAVNGASSIENNQPIISLPVRKPSNPSLKTSSTPPSKQSNAAINNIIKKGTDELGKGIIKTINTGNTLVKNVQSNTVRIGTDLSNTLIETISNIPFRIGFPTQATSPVLGVSSIDFGQILVIQASKILNIEDAKRNISNIPFKINLPTKTPNGVLGVSNVDLGSLIAIQSMKIIDIKKIQNTIADIPNKIAYGIQNGTSTLGIDIVNFGYLLIPEPTQISEVKVIASTPTSMTISWKTNNPATSKVNYGKTLDFGEDLQSNERATEHKLTVTELKPNTTYFYEVMSQGKRYAYDAHHTFKTPAK